MNPSDRPCFIRCAACLRCADRGRYAKCQGCSGRHDPQERKYPDPDDFCDCKRGIMRIRTNQGRLIVTKFPGNPFGGRAKFEGQTVDERDYESYVREQREKLNDEHYDAVTFDDDTSTMEWYKQHKRA